MPIPSEQELAEIRDLASELHRSSNAVLERIREARAEVGPSPLIAFVHIPKTAGGSVKAMFGNAFTRGGLRDAGNYLARPEAAVLRVSTPPGAGWDAWRKQGGRVMMGHTPYWLLRQNLPADAQYVTFLRDPVERVLSHYHRHLQLLRAPKNPADPKRQTAAIEEALDMRLPEVTNLATRLLCGFQPPEGELPRSALDDAKANLSEFAFVGIQERFEESLLLLQRRFGMDLIPYVNRHVSHNRPTADALTDEQRTKLLERNALDAELYEYALGLFDEALSETGEGVAADAERLRAKSATTHEEALRTARDWLLRELPAGTSKPRAQVAVEAKRAGVSGGVLKEMLNLLPITRERQDDGRMMWWLTDDARAFAARADFPGERTTSENGVAVSAPGTREPIVGFVHIHRTAGATAQLALRAAFSRSAVWNVHDYFRNPEAIAARLGRPPNLDWATWRRGGGRVVAGHVPYGLLREHVPADARYITFLRDPVDRVVSHYHGLIRRRGDLRDLEAPTADSLEEALAEMRLPELNDLATRCLCGSPSPLGDLPPGALDDAKANLRDFALVGLQERFDESIVLLQRILGQDIPPYLSANLGVDRPSADEISAETRALVIERNRLDAELYRFARELFEGLLESVDEDFAAEVESLRAESAAANERATQQALEWVDRELPADSSTPKPGLLAKARSAGIPAPAVKHVLNRLSVAQVLDEAGQVIYCRPSD